MSGTTVVSVNGTLFYLVTDEQGSVDIVRSPRVVVEVLIDAQRPQIEIYRRAGAFWNLFTAGPEDTIDLASLQIVVPVATIYQGVELPPEMDNDESQ